MPEVILDAPDALRQLHREFLRAGADVMVALTYYAHREKLSDVGARRRPRADEPPAVRIANEIAAEGGALVAGNICNTWSYDPADPGASGAVVRAQYEEQLGWARRGGRRLRHRRDQRLPRRGADRPRGLPASSACRRWSRSRACSRRPPTTATTTSRRAAILADARRRRCRAQLLARPGDDAAAAGARSAQRSTSRSPRSRSRIAPTPATPAFESLDVDDGAGCSRSSSSRSSARASRWRSSRAGARDIGVDYIGICCGGAPHHVRAMAEALGRETPASRYSPAIDLHPVLGTPRGDGKVMDGWTAA